MARHMANYPTVTVETTNDDGGIGECAGLGRVRWVWVVEVCVPTDWTRVIPQRLVALRMVLCTACVYHRVWVGAGLGIGVGRSRARYRCG